MDATALLFLKYYDPFLQKIEYIGKIAVNRSLKISELAPIMCAKKGLPVETPISIFEVIYGLYFLFIFLSFVGNQTRYG